MRTAKPDELNERVYPLFTARLSESELTTWFPFPFEEITDPEATPEPSKGALLKLHRGPFFVLYWGRDSNQLTIWISKTTDPARFLSAFFREASFPQQRIIWRRADAVIESRNDRQKTA